MKNYLKPRTIVAALLLCCLTVVAVDFTITATPAHVKAVTRFTDRLNNQRFVEWLAENPAADTNTFTAYTPAQVANQLLLSKLDNLVKQELIRLDQEVKVAYDAAPVSLKLQVLDLLTVDTNNVPVD